MPCRLLRVLGSGKTLIGALIIHSKLTTLKAAQQVAVLLAPTNPLAEQVRTTGAHLPALRRHIRSCCRSCLLSQHHMVLQTLRIRGVPQPLKSAAFYGDTGSQNIGTWSTDRYAVYNVAALEGFPCAPLCLCV